MLEFEPQATLTLTNFFSIGVELLSDNTLRYAYHNGEEYNTPFIALIHVDESGRDYFIAEGDAIYYLDEFIRVD